MYIQDQRIGCSSSNQCNCSARDNGGRILRYTCCTCHSALQMGQPTWYKSGTCKLSYL